jgi:hypothetical protein
MNLNDFMSLYATYSQKQKVLVKCKCGREKEILRERALDNIKNLENNGEYVCRSCSTKNSHAKFPRGEETRRKQSEAAKGTKKSEETKAKMSEAKKKFYQTPEGEQLRKKLSKSTSEQHSSNKFDKSKRKVLYISAKNKGEIRVCNSSYEFIACDHFLEYDHNVVSYDTQVPYCCGEKHRSMDFLIAYTDGTKKSVEVKPKKRMSEESHTKQLADSAANAKQNGWKWEVWTEENLNITRCKEATRLADEYRRIHYLVDYAAYRAQKDKNKAKRHYDKKTSQNKVVVFCTFCNVYHFPLKVSYDRNIEKNGGFICIRENGHLIGKRGKTHLKNPYANLGQKECSKCYRILPLKCFGSNGNGKISSRCKECRAEVAAEKYKKSKSENTTLGT